MGGGRETESRDRSSQPRLSPSGSLEPWAPPGPCTQVCLDLDCPHCPPVQLVLLSAEGASTSWHWEGLELANRADGHFQHDLQRTQLACGQQGHQSPHGKTGENASPVLKSPQTAVKAGKRGPLSRVTDSLGLELSARSLAGTYRQVF